MRLIEKIRPYCTRISVIFPMALTSFVLIGLWVLGIRQPLTQVLAEPVRMQAVGSNQESIMPFLDIVPSSDGSELFINVGGIEQINGDLLSNVGVGPGSRKNSYTMVFSETAQIYVATATGFSPGVLASAPLSMTTSLGQRTPEVTFRREYIPLSASPGMRILSDDTLLELNLPNTATFPSDAYVLIVPSYAPPGPAPVEWRFIGDTYSVRASGALVLSDKPMILKRFYTASELNETDLQTLALFAWDAATQNWDNLGGSLLVEQNYISVATSRFTTYALMAPDDTAEQIRNFLPLIIK